MDRRTFHKTVLAGAVASVAPLHTTGGPLTTDSAAALIPHPGDALPTGAAARLGTTRFWHIVEEGNAGVNALAFSPDGRLLAALGLQDSRISLWEVPTGRMIRKWKADDADRHGQLAFSPCGRLLAVGSSDGLRLWDPHSGRLVRQLADHRKGVDGIAFSPCGRLLAAAVWFDGAVDVWEVASGERVARFEADRRPNAPSRRGRSDLFNSVTFSADGELVAAGSQYNLYHESDGPEAKSIQKRLMETHGGCVQSGRGEITYIEEPHGRVWCWELASGKLIAKLEGHEFPVNRVHFTPGGRLISCATDGAVWAWDVTTAHRVAELGQSVGRVHESGAAFTWDGRRMALSRPGYVSLVDLADGCEVRRFILGQTWCGAGHLALSADARWLATERGGRISLWDSATGADVSPPARHTGWVRTTRFTPDGLGVATAAGSEAFLWDAATGQMLSRFEADDPISEANLAPSPDGAKAACVLRRNNPDPDGAPLNRLAVWEWTANAVRLWDVIGLTSIAWLPDGESILVGTEEAMVCVLHLRTGRRGPLLKGIVGEVRCVAVSPDGRFAAVLADEPIVCLWELSTGGRPRRLNAPALPCPGEGHYGPMTWLFFSPDGDALALVNEKGSVWAGPVEGAELPLVYTAPGIAAAGVGEFNVGFLPDGRLLAAGAAGIDEDEGNGPYMIRVWDVATGREVWASPLQRHPISALSFSPDGRTLASGAWDGTALLWDLGAQTDRPAISG